MKLLAPPFLLPAILLAQVAAPVNPLLDQFLKKGIDIPGAPPEKLPEPMLNERMNQKEIGVALAKAAGRVPLKFFLEKNVHNRDVESIENPPKNRVAQYVTVRFVAQGKLAIVLQKNMLNQLIGGANANVAELNEKDLAKRGIKPLAGKGVQEVYRELDMRVLDEVAVSGMTRNVTTSTGKSAFMTTILDDRFAMDKQFPNVWRPINQKGQLGKPAPYSGLGGYAFVMELPNPPGALYLEMHYVMHEPFGWFGGKNLLRSKLPIVIDDNVKKFCRELAKANPKR